MKKNNMFRIASVLLVAVLLSTCVISGAFAKYTTGLKEAADEARVAEWGIEVTANAEYFTTDYTSGKLSASAKTVQGEDRDDIVAPGTSCSDAALITITGTAEVAVKITKTATVSLENWADDEGAYCPIVITVNGDDYYVGLKDAQDNVIIADVAALELAVTEAILGANANAGVAEYEVAANTALDDDYDVEVSWAWAFEDGTPDQDNDRDTNLAINAYKGTNVPTIEISATVIVDQLN